jgi:hypothetical protein
MDRALRRNPSVPGELFRSYDWNVEIGYTVRAKVNRYDWGMLQGLLESSQADVRPEPTGR